MLRLYGRRGRASNAILAREPTLRITRACESRLYMAWGKSLGVNQWRGPLGKDLALYGAPTRHFAWRNIPSLLVGSSHKFRLEGRFWGEQLAGLALLWVWCPDAACPRARRSSVAFALVAILPLSSTGPLIFLHRNHIFWYMFNRFGWPSVVSLVDHWRVYARRADRL